MPYLRLLLLCALLSSGCATLSESECRSANWYAIGLEDGARGMDLERFGKHRRACAEYGIAAELDPYREGRQQGLQSFCREANGFYQGKAGYIYKDICPIELEYEFLTGYQAGHNLFRLNQKIERYSRAISDRKSDIDHLYHRIHQERKRLDNDEIDASVKKKIRRRINRLRRRIGLIQSDIFDLEFSRTSLESDYDQLSSQYHY